MAKQILNITINMTVEIIESEKHTKVENEPAKPPSVKQDPVRNEDQFYTCNQVAEILNVNKQLVWKHIRDGKLTVVNFGREYRIREEDLNTYITSLTKTAG